MRSPFLEDHPNIQWAWDSTSLGYFKTCPRLYQYIMIDGWQGREESVHLRFGIEYHRALEHFDRLMAESWDFNSALREVVRDTLIRTEEWKPDLATKAGKYKNRATLIGLVIDYLDHFRIEHPKTLILADGSPAVEFTFNFFLPWGPDAAVEKQTRVGEKAWKQAYLLTGHLDRVVEYAGARFVMDRKTTTWTISPYYFDQFEPNNQMSLYSLASSMVLKAPIKGVIIDAAQILLEKPNKFERSITYRTPDQLNEWLDDLKIILREAESYAEANYWPMRDTSCDKYGGCRFRAVCSKSPPVRDVFLRSNFDKLPEEERWNPLAIR